MAKKVKKVAFLTAGGLAPCLSSSIGFLIDEYTKKAPEVELIGYLDGYMGLLKGESVKVTDDVLGGGGLDGAFGSVVEEGGACRGVAVHRGRSSHDDVQLLGGCSHDFANVVDHT